MPDQLGQYKIHERVGAGGIGDVWRGRDIRLGRTVAIKLVKPEIADDIERRRAFLAAARTAQKLSHPSIATLEEVNDQDGQLYVVQEFVAGDTLEAAIGGKPMNPKRAIDYAIQIADALADIHASGIVYQDLKPANIIVTSKGATKLLDVGLAEWTSGHGVRTHAAKTATATSAAAASGTLAYMSPEQALGGRCDHRTDIFSLGAVLMEMLTGRPVFTGPTPDAIPLQVMQAKVPRPSATAQGIPRELDPILEKMLAKSLETRYQSAASVAADLRSVTTALGVRSEAAETHDSMMRTTSDRPSGLAWAVALVVLLGAGVLVWFATQAQ